MNDIDGLLIDLNGVLYVGDEAVDGAAAAVERLRAAHVPLRFLTNTTTACLQALHDKLTGLGLPIEGEEIISALRAARLHLEQRGRPRCRLVLGDDACRDFDGFERDDESPEAIVVGDIGEAWDYRLLHELSCQLLEGAELVALHKSRFSQTPQGLKLDIGPFVAALEHAAGCQATVVGKPSPDFFELALQEMGLEAGRVAIVGDDVENDVGGAQRAGLTGILVRTGKYREATVQASGVRPDATIASIAELPDLLL